MEVEECTFLKNQRFAFSLISVLGIAHMLFNAKLHGTFRTILISGEQMYKIFGLQHRN